jgi:DNA-binding transcriptional MocR family regulator
VTPARQYPTGAVLAPERRAALLEWATCERAVIEAAARRSIRVYGGADYRAKRLAGPPTLLVGYGGLPESTIPEAVKQLAFVLAECSQRTSSNR